MNKLEQAARQLLSVLENGMIDIKAVAALREALAEQAEQEPVAWKDLTYGNLHHQDFGNSTPLYAAPVRTKDLTDDEIADVGSKLAAKNVVSDIAFARAVIAADREKNK